MTSTPVIGPPYNTTQIAKENATVIVTVVWDWDGVPRSVSHPEYTGSVISIRVQNVGTVTWYAKLPRKTKGTRSVTIAAGMDQTYSGGVLNSMGLDVITDIGDLTLTTTP
jgi:hypothetical protein